jgi:hypothetical protein
VSQLIHPQYATIDGLSIRFAEGGKAGRDAILLSPWPESVFAFEQVWAQLAENAHLIAALTLRGSAGPSAAMN